MSQARTPREDSESLKVRKGQTFTCAVRDDSTQDRYVSITLDKVLRLTKHGPQSPQSSLLLSYTTPLGPYERISDIGTYFPRLLCCLAV